MNYGKISAGVLLTLGVLSFFYGDYVAARDFSIGSTIISAINYKEDLR